MTGGPAPISRVASLTHFCPASGMSRRRSLASADRWTAGRPGCCRSRGKYSLPIIDRLLIGRESSRRLLLWRWRVVDDPRGRLGRRVLLGSSSVQSCASSPSSVECCMRFSTGSPARRRAARSGGLLRVDHSTARVRDLPHRRLSGIGRVHAHRPEHQRRAGGGVGAAFERDGTAADRLAVSPCSAARDSASTSRRSDLAGAGEPRGVQTRPSLKATIHNAVRDGPAGQNQTGVPDFRAHLLGRIAWVEQLNPAHGAKLRHQFKHIVWSRAA
jgi:hypothetical protein